MVGAFNSLASNMFSSPTSLLADGAGLGQRALLLLLLLATVVVFVLANV